MKTESNYHHYPLLSVLAWRERMGQLRRRLPPPPISNQLQLSEKKPRNMQFMNHAKHTLHTLVACLFVLAFAIMGAGKAWGTVTLTAASSGGSISADTAATASSPAWTSLGAITIKENAGGVDASILSGSPALSVTANASTAVGPYPITVVQGTLSVTDTNYNLSRVHAALTITPAALAVAAEATSKAYGEPDPALTWQITSGSLVNGV